MKSIASLSTGDQVGIISTARKITAEELQPAIKVLNQWGLEVKLGKHIYADYHQFAGTDQQRLEDLQDMLDNPEIKAVICARGGYGTVRLIDAVDFTAFRKNPKWIVGYSDITVLHSHIHNLGFETLHATMPINFPKNGMENQALQSLRKALFEGELEYLFSGFYLNSHISNSVQAPVTGGNLSMLYSLLGSASSLDSRGKILFFEDLDEYLYHIDRMMWNLKRNHYFDDLKAVIVGGLSDMNDNTIPFGFTAEEIVSQHFAEVKYPVIFNFPAGHIEDNRAIILGRKALLESAGNQIRFKQ